MPMRTMYVLERIEPDSDRVLLSSPDRESCELLLRMIAQHRSRHATTANSAEHLRAFAYRLKQNPETTDLITLEREHFRLREDPEAPAAQSPSKMELRRICRDIPPQPNVVRTKTSAEVAVAQATADTGQGPRWIGLTSDQKPQIDGERFEI